MKPKSKFLDHRSIPPEVGLQPGVTIDGELYSPTVSQMAGFYSRRVGHFVRNVLEKIILKGCITLDHDTIFEYDDRDGRSAPKIMSLDRGAMCIVDTNDPFHVFSVERHSYLFVKPGCPGVACNSLERGSEIYVPKGVPVFLGGKNVREAKIFEYDPEKVDEILSRVLRGQRFHAEHPFARMEEDVRRMDRSPGGVVERVSGSGLEIIQGIVHNEGLINISLDHDRTSTLDITDRDFPFIHVSLRHGSQLRVGSSTGKKVSVFVENISHGSTLICDPNVEAIFVKSAHFDNVLKCSRSCKVQLGDLDKGRPGDLLIQRGDWTNEFPLLDNHQ